jgi:tRNA threonylcarbamoyladenosine biosynthesis protein TsaE
MSEDGSMGVDQAMEFVSKSPEITMAFAEALGRELGPGAVVALNGDLGAGKTTFVRGLCIGLDVTDPVHSPSYTLMHTYQGRLEVFHFDAWMEGREAAFLDGGGAEWLFGEGVAVVEWASRVRDYLPAEHLEIELLHLKAPQIDDDGHPVGEPIRGLRAWVHGESEELRLLLHSAAQESGLREALRGDLPPSPGSRSSLMESQSSLNHGAQGPLEDSDRLS